MKIGLVLHPYGVPGDKGSGGAFAPLTHALLSESGRVTVCYTKTKLPEEVTNQYPSIVFKTLGPLPTWLFGAFFLDRSPDVYLFLTPVIPVFFKPKKSIVVAHDFAYLVLEANTIKKWFARMFLSRIHASSLQRADKVIAISKATKDFIVNTFRTPQSKIEVIYNGFTPIIARSDVNTTHPFFLYVGALKPRKNILNVIEAFGQFLQKRPHPYTLVIVGKGGGSYEKLLRKRVKDLGIESQVRFMGYVPSEELSRLYAEATAFVFPSLVEGFGLPILESMSAGLPVITSNEGALAEIAGNAALLISPTDIHSLSEALARIIDEPGLGQYLRTQGYLRIKDFSWEQTAKQYQNVLSDRSQSSSRY